MSANNDILDSVKLYLQQQSELYGPDFYVRLESGRTTRPETSNPQVGGWEDLRKQAATCRRCALAESRTHVVFGVGNEKANLMCIGEAPGFEEDKAGEPFVGKAGQLLNKILAAIGFARDEVYIANVIKCRPPNNRDPSPEEVEQCLPYLRRQIELVDPKLILVLGRIAAHNLLNSTDSLTRLRGRVHTLENRKVVVTYHPAALLRNPQWKRSTWEDVQLLRKLYDECVGDKPPLQTGKS